MFVQEGHPVTFASRSLNQTEQKYAQIEKETLAILFAVQKFHLFIYGLDVKIHSDHKPLETIFRKDTVDFAKNSKNAFKNVKLSFKRDI